MPTFKAEVYAHQKKQDGSYNIKIRVTHNQKKRYLATPWFVFADDLTRSLKIKNQRYIDLCTDLIRTYRSRCDQLGQKADSMDVDRLVEYMTSRPEQFRLPFISFCREQRDKLLKEGREGTYGVYNNSIRVFEAWLGRDVDINDISSKMVQEYIDHLRESRKPATICSYMATLKTCYNTAMRMYNDEVVNVKNNPFSAVKLPMVSEVEKKALSVDLIKQIRDADCSESRAMELSRDVFMLSFYLVGINLADLFSCTSLEGWQLTYNRQKTKNRRFDHSLMSIEIPEEARPLVEKYRGRFDHVFNFHYVHGNMTNFCAKFRYGIALLGRKLGIPHLTFYAARHSWATLAANDAGVDIYTVHLALNHASQKMSITEIYIKRDFSAIDRANRKVLDLLL